MESSQQDSHNNSSSNSRGLVNGSGEDTTNHNNGTTMVTTTEDNLLNHDNHINDNTVPEERELSADALKSHAEAVAAKEVEGTGDFVAAAAAALGTLPSDQTGDDDNVENRPPLDVISATHHDDTDTIGSSRHVRQASSVQSHLEDDVVDYHNNSVMMNPSMIPTEDLPLTTRGETSQVSLTPSLIVERDEGMDDMTNLVGGGSSVTGGGGVDGAAHTPRPLPSRTSFVPGPLREEPTLKEKLVDRERQRRKEAERARLKRQFALMSNGGAGGMVFDGQSASNHHHESSSSHIVGGGGGGGGGAPSSMTGVMRENGSIAGTVGEESIRSIPYLEEALSHSHGHAHHPSQDQHDSHQDPPSSRTHHHHQGDQQSPQQLGYTMERFLQERDAATANANSTRTTSNIAEVAEVAAAASSARANSPSNEGTGSIGDNNADGTDVHDIDVNDNSTHVNVIREETIEAGPNTSVAPDKGVVMERFLNDPVVVDPRPPPSSTALQDEEEDPQSRPEDVHRSVSFDMELRTALYNSDSLNINRNSTNGRISGLDDNNQRPSHISQGNSMMNEHLHLSIDDSNASVRVEVAPEDTIDNLTEPVSPGRQPSLPSEVALQSSLGQDNESNRRHHHEHHDNHRDDLLETDTSLLGSVGPSMDRQSTSSNNHDNDDSTTGGDQPRFFRLTEAEIQEMAAIEEASIGNAPPSDRDAESLVGDLVVEFGNTPSAVGDNDVDGDRGGTTFSQGTPTTAMESGSITSRNQISIGAPRSSTRNNDADRGDHEDNLNNLNDMDHQSIDAMAAMAPSVSSHLVVSPGVSVSGSAVSVAANPPSEIIERGGPAAALLLDDDEGADGRSDNEVLPPPPIVVGSPSVSRRSPSPPRIVLAQTQNNDNVRRGTDDDDDDDIALLDSNTLEDQHGSPTGLSSLMPPSRPDCENSASIRAELASAGPPAIAIVNRRLRPGMARAEVGPSELSPMRRTVSLPENINGGRNFNETPGNNQTVDEFDWDKHDLPDIPMTPHSVTDSFRDLPGDDLWTSPGIQVAGSPVRRQVEAAQSHPSLMIPTMTRSGKTVHAVAAEEPLASKANLSKLELVFRDLQMGTVAAVEAKDLEIYNRGSILSKALRTRLLPLIVTSAIELSALKMIGGGSDRLCSLLGRQNQQLLIGFLPLIAALSGEISTQASTSTLRAVSQGHLSDRNVKKYMLDESKVAALLGLGLGALLAIFAFLSASNKNVPFAFAVGTVQCTSAILAGCTGSMSPLLLCYLFKHNARHLGGCVERAVPDVIAAFLTTGFLYFFLSILVTPNSDPRDGCPVS